MESNQQQNTTSFGALLDKDILGNEVKVREHKERKTVKEVIIVWMQMANLMSERSIKIVRLFLWNLIVFHSLFLTNIFRSFTFFEK